MRETLAKRGWAKTGCLGAAAVMLFVVVAAIALSGVAVLQNRSEEPKLVRLDQSVIPPAASPGTDTLAGGAAAGAQVAPGRLVLDLAVCQLVVLPGPAGSPIRVEGFFEQDRFELKNSTLPNANGSWTTHVSLLPTGSESWELFRVKLGGVLPRLRISIPPDVPIEIAGDVRKGLAALELGGLWIPSAEFEVSGGNVDLSFSEPTLKPMESIDVKLHGGAMDIGPMGNASPAHVSLMSRLGALDLDLRGSWKGDAVVTVEGNAAGGSIWLPTNMRVVGTDRPATSLGATSEIAPLTLDLDIKTPSNRIILLE